MRAVSLHPWRVSYAEAVAIQNSCRDRVRIEPLEPRPVLVAGADVASSRRTHRMYAAIVVVRLPDFEVVEVAGAAMSARFPYIPGLFSFREVPPLLRAFARLRTRPDAILFDGHGRAHPRRFGLACHAGVLLDCPSVGCAKSILVGEHVPVGLSRGARAPLVAGGETIGAALRTRPGVRPVYVSVGHRVDLDSAVRLVLATTRGFRLPDPIRRAHQATAESMRRLDPGRLAAELRAYPDFRSV